LKIGHFEIARRAANGLGDSFTSADMSAHLQCGREVRKFLVPFPFSDFTAWMFSKNLHQGYPMVGHKTARLKIEFDLRV
jgi:hypothetical protein